MDFDPKLLVKDKLGNTPLHYAAEKYPEVLNSMLKKAQGLGTQIKSTVVFFFSNLQSSFHLSVKKQKQICVTRVWCQKIQSKP